MNVRAEFYDQFVDLLSAGWDAEGSSFPDGIMRSFDRDNFIELRLGFIRRGSCFELAPYVHLYHAQLLEKINEYNVKNGSNVSLSYGQTLVSLIFGVVEDVRFESNEFLCVRSRDDFERVGRELFTILNEFVIPGLSPMMSLEGCIHFLESESSGQNRLKKYQQLNLVSFDTELKLDLARLCCAKRV